MRPLSAAGFGFPKARNATLVIVVALGVMSVVTILVPMLEVWLGFIPRFALSRPWTAITYPFSIQVAGGLTGPLFTLILLLWTFNIGSSVESDQTRARYLAFWAVATVLPALLLFAAGAPLYGPSLPIAALTVAWAARRPNSQLLLFGILPVAAKWIGALAALGIFVQYVQSAGPLAGVLSVVSLGIACAWALNRIPGLPYKAVPKPDKAGQQREIDFMKEVSRRKDERAERERLRRLLDDDGR